MPESSTNTAEYTVSEISFAVKRTLENAYGYVRIRGEVSGYRGPHSSGHCYFGLKDDKAKIDAVIWRGVFSKLKFKPEEGLEVIATGKVTSYPGRSSYQIIIEALEPAGVGALMALLEERRKKLAAEGLFDEERKKQLPYLPKVIGVVTSPTGAVIRDIMHRLSDRFPCHVMIWPVRVQGETSANEVAAAIEGFNNLQGGLPKPDLLIVARGGGSLEDLWGFNEEAVVRAVAASDIPVISAVGHETDWTLIDHAADLRAPTPTGAAEMAVPVRSDLLAGISDLSRRLTAAQSRLLDTRRVALRSAARALPKPRDLMALARQRFDDVSDRLLNRLRTYTLGHRARFDRQAVRLTPTSLKHAFTRHRQTLDGLHGRMNRSIGETTARRRRHLEATGKLLSTLSYQGVLERGFALVRKSDDTPLRSAQQVEAGEALTIEFHDSRLSAIAGGDAAVQRTKPRRKPPKSGSKETDQGSLF